MNSTLRKNRRCPIHQRFDCCGRKPAKRMEASAPKKHVERVEDPHHPRGYREVCSTAEKKRRKDELLRQADACCYLCDKGFDDYRDVELEHIEPKGAGGARTDDHRDNLRLAHRKCNAEKGSRRLNPNRQTMDQLREEFHSQDCPVCGDMKHDGHALCSNCYYALPPQLQHDLYRMSGVFNGSYSYPDAVADAKDYLRRAAAAKNTGQPATEPDIDPEHDEVVRA